MIVFAAAAGFASWRIADEVGLVRTWVGLCGLSSAG
jgi:hypothetical protein